MFIDFACKTGRSANHARGLYCEGGRIVVRMASFIGMSEDDLHSLKFAFQRAGDFHQLEHSLVQNSNSSRRLSEILLASITALAGTGEVERACRLAGQACVALRSTDPAAAHRFDALLHRLTPTLKW